MRGSGLPDPSAESFAPDGRQKLRRLSRPAGVTYADHSRERLRSHGLYDWDLAPGRAATITAIVICCFFAVAITYILGADHSALGLVVCIVLMLVLFGLQLTHSFPSLLPRAARHQRWTLSAQAVLTYAPFPAFGSGWLGMPGFLAASVLLLLPSPWAPLACAAVVGSVVPVQFMVGFGTDEVGYNTMATMLTGLVVYGLSRLSTLMREVHETRGELARAAVVHERLRFARDLHDLLGYSLATIKLKGELAYRLMLQEDAQAGVELREIITMASQALADVRSVASSYREMRLAPEIDAAESLLNAMGIHTDSRTDPGTPAAPVDTLLATALREAITNMLRHSKAEHCVIEALACKDGTLRLSVANDGVGASTPRLGGRGEGGSGLVNLTERVAAFGGVFRAGLREDGWFELSVAVRPDAVAR